MARQCNWSKEGSYVLVAKEETTPADSNLLDIARFSLSLFGSVQVDEPRSAWLLLQTKAMRRETHYETFNMPCINSGHLQRQDSMSQVCSCLWTCHPLSIFAQTLRLSMDIYALGSLYHICSTPLEVYILSIHSYVFNVIACKPTVTASTTW